MESGELFNAYAFRHILLPNESLIHIQKCEHGILPHKIKYPGCRQIQYTLADIYSKKAVD